MIKKSFQINHVKIWSATLIISLLFLLILQSCNTSNLTKMAVETPSTQPNVPADTSIPSPKEHPSPTMRPTKATTNLTPQKTEVPPGTFALTFYPPLALNYDEQTWVDRSEYDNSEKMINFLQHQQLKTCTVAVQGPSGFYPADMDRKQLGDVTYEVHFLERDTLEKQTIAYFAIDAASCDISNEAGIPVFSVSVSLAEMEQCQTEAERIFTTLHSAAADAPSSVINGILISKKNATSLIVKNTHLPFRPDAVLWPEPLRYPFIENGVFLLQVESTLYPIRFSDLIIDAPLDYPLKDKKILAFAPDASLALADEGNKFKLFRLNGREYVVQSLIHIEKVHRATFSGDSRFLAVTSPEAVNTFVFALYEGWAGRNDYFEPMGDDYDAVVSPGGKTLLWTSGKMMQIDDFTVPAVGFEYRETFSDTIGPAVFSQSGQWVAIGAGRQVALFNRIDKSLFGKLELSEPVQNLAFSPDESLLSVSDHVSIQLWDISSLTSIATLPVNKTRLLAFAPQGNYLISINEENILSLWYPKRFQ